MSAPLSQRHGEACRFEHMQCMQCRRFECLHSPRWHLCRQPFHQMSCWKLIIFHHGWIYIPLILWACMGNSTLWIKETSTPQGPLIAHTHGHTVTTSSREAIDSVGMCWLQAYLINSMCLPSWHIFFLTQWWCEGEGRLDFWCFFLPGLLLCFSCFCAFPASLPFLLLCVSAFSFSCFSAFLLVCFCAVLFSASLLFLLLLFLIFFFSASVPFYFYFFFLQSLQSCVFAALLPAPLLLCFLSLLPLCFFCSFALSSPVCKKTP